MAPRRGELAQEPSLSGLQFNEPLSWRAGKAIPTGTLLHRLDSLSNELREMDQEETDKDSLTAIAKELVGPNLVNHKDKGVRAFTACCLVDILKLCAPDAPFTGSQLKDIFTLFIVHILPALSDPSNAYNTQQKYVLVSLAEVKSVVLLMDIPNSDPLILHLFGSFFDALSGSAKTSSGEQIAKDIQYHMTQILVTLLDEAESLPAEVVDIVVAQFLRVSTPVAGKAKGTQDEKQSTLLTELPEAYTMAKTICDSCPEKMARYVSQYFNDVILDVSASSHGPKSNGHRRQSDVMGSDDEEAPMGHTEADMKELQKAHRLLRELWRASPAVLQNVIPQLEAELSAESVQLRLLATETLGDIISGIGGAGPPSLPTMDPAAYPPTKLDEESTTPTSNTLTTPLSPQSFAQTHPSVYQSFLGRKNDKSLVIRTGWTTAIGRILVTSAGGIGLSREDETTLVKSLGEKLCDSDEKVRLAAVKAIAGFNLRDVMTKLAPNGDVSTSGSVLSNLADRARDRKHAIRVEAMTTLGRIWAVATGEITSGNESVIAALGDIPSRIIDAYYANDPELNVLLDRVLFEQLIPLSYPPKKAKGKANGNSQTQTNGDSSFDADKVRTERILLVVKSLNARSKKAFFAMQARQSTYSNALTSFLKRCEDFNGGVMDDNSKEIKLKLEGMVKWFAALLPDPLRVTSDLQKYAKMHDRRSYQLLRFAMASESDFKTVYNSIKEFSKRIESAPTAPAGLLDTLIPIVYRSASIVYNKSHLPAIMQYSRSDDKGFGGAAHDVNHEISERMPDIFKSNVTELCKLLSDDVPSATKVNDIGSVEALRDLAQFASSGTHELPKDRKFTQTLINYALYATPPKAAKYAVSILAAATDKKELHMKGLLTKAITDWTYGEDNFLTRLATISQLTLLDPKVTADFDDEILDITTKQILLQVRTTANSTDHSWQPESEIDEECEAKCWALKILVNRLRSTEDTEVAKNTAIPIYKLLNSLIAKEGELSKNNDTPKHHKSRLRLLAAQLILKLCRIKVFDEMLTPTEFVRLACVAQDPLTNIRRGFIEKVQKYLVKTKLSNRFYTIIFLTAFEPNIDFKKSIVTWIRSQAKVFHQKKTHVMESIFPRVLSLLAHHPDYAPDPDNLKDHARYILYYLNSIGSEENLGLVYKYAERVKQARDAINVKESERLYVLSDLAQAVIMKWELKKGWRMQTYPSKVGLPLGIFSALPSHEVAQEIAETDYLPDGMDEILDGVVRNSNKPIKRKAPEDGNPPVKKVKSEPRPRSRPSEPKPKKTPKPKKRRSSGTSVGTPAITSADRRRSGRAASAKKNYADRDDNEDDKEMMDGVLKWQYVDEDEDRESPSSNDSSSQLDDAEEESDIEMQEAEDPKPTAVTKHKPAESPAPETEEEEEVEEEEEAEPTPPPPSAKRSRARPAPKKATPTKPSPSPAKTTKLKPKSPIAKARAKKPLAVSKPTAKAPPKQKPIKGKGKAKVKDVFDMDESD